MFALRERGVAQLAAALPLSLLLVAGCNLNPFDLGGSLDDGGAGGDDAGDIDAGVIADAGTPDADRSPDACIPEDEVCDHVDNDCDGEIDEDTDTTSDPYNCGDCGVRCSEPHAAGTCVDSMCEYECLPGYVDNDPPPDGDLGEGGNGCEYLCIQTNGGVEACDFTDNDCDCIGDTNGDGTYCGPGDTGVDEDFDLLTDEDNCGGCGKPCLVLHATPECVGGVCQCEGGDCSTSCDPGYADVIPEILGCEYVCPENPPAPPGEESCDGVDNDCDGETDELPIIGLGDDCTPPGFESFGDKGECEFGVTACALGTPYCSGYVGPTGEICDQLDNDCDCPGDTNGDGTVCGAGDEGVDEAFDLDNDPRNCGPTCEVCSYTNGIAGCSGGVCELVACEPGWVDDPDIAGEDCLYACTPTGPEVCDGVDNDCDRLFDTDDGDLVGAPPMSFCIQTNACAGTTPECGPSPCDSTVTWRCLYGGDTEADSCGDLPLEEEVCDDIDGDCDGQVDDLYLTTKGGPCDDELLGECRGFGVWVCNAAGDDLECNITDPGDAPEPAELACDNRDEDCNGTPDDGAPDTMVHVTSGGLDFWIDAYEASRPDATASSSGLAEHRPCSNPDVLPWRSASWVEANDACVAAGKRLCTEAEWMEACQGSSALKYPYGDLYVADACNGEDYDPDCLGEDDDICLPVGEPHGCPTPPGTSACVSEAGALDMSGNLKEWTATQVSVTPPAYRIRGGAYDTIKPGLTCQFDFVAGGKDYFFPNLGFRCCSDTAP